MVAFTICLTLHVLLCILFIAVNNLRMLCLDYNSSLCGLYRNADRRGSEFLIHLRSWLKQQAIIRTKGLHQPAAGEQESARTHPTGWLCEPVPSMAQSLGSYGPPHKDVSGRDKGSIDEKMIESHSASLFTSAAQRSLTDQQCSTWTLLLSPRKKDLLVYEDQTCANISVCSLL